MCQLESSSIQFSYALPTMFSYDSTMGSTWINQPTLKSLPTSLSQPPLLPPLPGPLPAISGPPSLLRCHLFLLTPQGARVIKDCHKLLRNQRSPMSFCSSVLQHTSFHQVKVLPWQIPMHEHLTPDPVTDTLRTDMTANQYCWYSHQMIIIGRHGFWGLLNSSIDAVLLVFLTVVLMQSLGTSRLQSEVCAGSDLLAGPKTLLLMVN